MTCAACAGSPSVSSARTCRTRDDAPHSADRPGTLRSGRGSGGSRRDMDVDVPKTAQPGRLAGRDLAKRITLIALRPVFLAMVIGIMSALVAVGVFPFFAGAGVAVKLADSKF